MVQTLFGLAYVAHDRSAPAPFALEALTFLVDYMQVWRVLMQPAFGWTESTYRVVKFGDVVYVASWLVALPLPRYALFVAAALVTLTMLGVVALSAQMLKSGDLSDKKLVSALRVMVGLFCNVAFTSILQFLLIPVDCTQPNQTEISFLEEIRGADAECEPFQSPEVVASVTGVILVPVATLVTLMFGSLAIETHPLAYTPEAKSEGGLAYVFILFKALAVVAPYLVPFITDMACAMVLLIMAGYLINAHIQMLPFQMQESNCLRAAGYAGLAWTAMSCLAISIVRRVELSGSIFQIVQWVLTGGMPMAMMLGVYLATERRSGILLELERLRGDWEVQAQIGADKSKTPKKSSKAEPGSGSSDQEDDADGDDKETERSEGQSKVHFSLRTSKKKTAHSKFFNPRWEMQRAARSGQVAHTIARTLLSMRQEQDLPFLAYVVSRGIEENPTSEEMVLSFFSFFSCIFFQAGH